MFCTCAVVPDRLARLMPDVQMQRFRQPSSCKYPAHHELESIRHHKYYVCINQCWYEYENFARQPSSINMSVSVLIMKVCLCQCCKGDVTWVHAGVCEVQTAARHWHECECADQRLLALIPSLGSQAAWWADTLPDSLQGTHLHSKTQKICTVVHLFELTHSFSNWLVCSFMHWPTDVCHLLGVKFIQSWVALCGSCFDSQLINSMFMLKCSISDWKTSCHESMLKSIVSDYLSWLSMSLYVLRYYNVVSMRSESSHQVFTYCKYMWWGATWHLKAWVQCCSWHAQCL